MAKTSLEMIADWRKTIAFAKAKLSELDDEFAATHGAVVAAAPNELDSVLGSRARLIDKFAALNDTVKRLGEGLSEIGV